MQLRLTACPTLPDGPAGIALVVGRPVAPVQAPGGGALLTSAVPAAGKSTPVTGVDSEVGTGADRASGRWSQ